MLAPAVIPAIPQTPIPFTPIGDVTKVKPEVVVTSE